MQEQYVSRVAICAGVAWVGVALLIGLGWYVALAGPRVQAALVGGMCAATGCALSAVAAVLSIRRYASRICRLIRNLHGVDAVERGELHAIR